MKREPVWSGGQTCSVSDIRHAWPEVLARMSGPVTIYSNSTPVAVLSSLSDDFLDHPMGYRHTINTVLGIARELEGECSRCGDDRGAEALSYLVDVVRERMRIE